MQNLLNLQQARLCFTISGVFLLLAALAGCNFSPSYRIAQFKAQCENFGYEPGSVEFAQCVHGKDAIWQNNFQRTMSNFGKNDQSSSGTKNLRTNCDITFDKPIMPGAIDISGQTRAQATCR